MKRLFLVAIVALLATHGFAAETPAPRRAERPEPSAITLNEFEESDAERINRAIKAAGATTGRPPSP